MPIQHVSTPRNRTIPRGVVAPRPEPVSLRKALMAARGTVDWKNSKWVRVSRVVQLSDNTRRKVLRCETITEKPNTPPERGHFCSFRPLDPAYTGALSKCPAIVFDCNCHRWLFVWEFAMFYRGAARLLRSNGEYPEVTNPRLNLGICKHLIVGAQALISRRI